MCLFPVRGMHLFPACFLAILLSLTLGCGSGSAHTEPAQMVFPAATVPLTKLSSDPYTNSTSQHATEVEPDTFAFGSTIVTAFQVGRIPWWRRLRYRLRDIYRRRYYLEQRISSRHYSRPRWRHFHRGQRRLGRLRRGAWDVAHRFLGYRIWSSESAGQQIA